MKEWKIHVAGEVWTWGVANGELIIRDPERHKTVVGRSDLWEFRSKFLDERLKRNKSVPEHIWGDAPTWTLNVTPAVAKAYVEERLLKTRRAPAARKSRLDRRSQPHRASR